MCVLRRFSCDGQVVPVICHDGSDQEMVLLHGEQIVARCRYEYNAPESAIATAQPRFRTRPHLSGCGGMPVFCGTSQCGRIELVGGQQQARAVRLFAYASGTQFTALPDGGATRLTADR